MSEAKFGLWSRIKHRLSTTPVRDLEKEKQILNRINQARQRELKLYLEQHWIKRYLSGMVVVGGIVLLYALINPSYVHQYYYTWVKGSESKRQMNEYVRQMEEEEIKFNDLIRRKYEEKLTRSWVTVEPQQINKSNFFD